MPDGGLLVDPACGTGTTGMASLRTNVFAILIDIEKDPLMFKLARRRLEQYYLFLKAEGLLRPVGTEAAPPHCLGDGWPVLATQIRPEAEDGTQSGSAEAEAEWSSGKGKTEPAAEVAQGSSAGGCSTVSTASRVADNELRGDRRASRPDVP